MFDLFSPAFKANPFPTFARLRQSCPFYPHAAPDGSTIWYITRYEDVGAVLKDHTRFVKDIRHAQNTPRTATAAINHNMLFSDPPLHTRLRALVNQAFTPRRVRGMEFTIRAAAEQLLDRTAHQGGMDVIADYALPLPVWVICDLLGIPPADRAQVQDWSQAIIAPGRRGLNFSQRKRKVRDLLLYFRALFADRRRAPQDDLISDLLQAEEAGDRLTDEELTSMVALLVVTGHETTVNLIGNGVLALLQHPAQWAQLQVQPDLLASAVEEMLRYDGPVETSTTRWAAEDVAVSGGCIRRGDVVRVVLASANRDAAYFANPDTFDITRRDNRHLAFGHGIHYCLGAALARLEGQLAVEALLTRFPDLRLAAPQLAWRSGVLFRGLSRLPVVSR